MERIQKGFTLIELVIVIAVLGILAAIAIPKYISVEQKARYATLKGMESALHSTVLLARAKYKSEGGTGTSVDMDGTSVTVSSGTGIPVATSAGVTAALQSYSGFTPSYTTLPNVASFAEDGAPATCTVTINDTGTINVAAESAC